MSLVNFERLSEAFARTETVVLEGRVVRATGLLVEASLPRVAVGTACEIHLPSGRTLPAEVVAFKNNIALLMPFGEMQGICEGCRVLPRSSAGEIPVGLSLLGRVVDAAMRPADGGPELLLTGRAPLSASPPPAMSRRRISRPVSLGVRVLDTCLTLGEGQRMGIMAAPGVGKSVLLGMSARHADADVIVVGLVGERGREVREFVERDLGPEGLKRSVVIVATSDEPPLVRVRAAMAATSVAEWFRARGKRVLLLVDSLSRVCMAQREMGLAAGEPPTAKGYPPSVFSALPRLLERAGNDSGPGSITALYTVLAEGDDMNDPITDAARSILDGHVVLSRKLAGGNHFPAVDVLQSVSRVMGEVTTPEHRELSGIVRDQLAAYQEAADLIDVGAYSPGSNPRVDRALKCRDALTTFLRQRPEECFALEETLDQLKRVIQLTPESRRA